MDGSMDWTRRGAQSSGAPARGGPAQPNRAATLQTVIPCRYTTHIRPWPALGGVVRSAGIADVGSTAANISGVLRC